MSGTDLSDPSLYLNRELSLLEFNRRVLAQAADETVPLLERLRFLTICSSNLDEFFEVRVAGLKQQLAHEIASASIDGHTPAEQLERISTIAHALVKQQYRHLNQDILPALANENIRILRRTLWSPLQRSWVRGYFQRQVLPVLTPVGLDPAHPFPKLQNKSLNFIIQLRGTDAFGRIGNLAVLQVPRCLPRLIPVPPTPERPHDVVMLSSVIHDCVHELFPGMEVRGCYQFRVTRNSDLWVDEEEVDDLLKALKGELLSRAYGAAVRLEVADNCPDDISAFLLNRFDLETTDLYQVKGPVNAHRLGALYDLVARPDLKYQPFAQGLPPQLSQATDLFASIRASEVLLHHPYQSFAPVVELLRQAAHDPQVLAIKQTVYRTSADSPLVAALVEAANNGKEVTAVVELRARFDEAANIALATRLQNAGANVVYGVVGYKTHAKMLMIVRREGEYLRRYCHLGTGNYHPATTRFYTDLGLLTCAEDIGEDVHRVFNQLTGLGRGSSLSTLLQSPFSLHPTLLELIEAEATSAREGQRARIIARMNALSEPEVIRALYRASQAGVQIDLIVRGVCCLRPGIPGVSENIRVRSIVGRFLEHARVYSFHAEGRDLVWIASADWMERNLLRRVEAAAPVRHPEIKRRVLDESMRIYLDDNRLAWELQPDGSYTRAHASGRERNAQSELVERLSHH